MPQEETEDDVIFTGLVQGADVGENGAAQPREREVMDEALHPREVVGLEVFVQAASEAVGWLLSVITFDAAALVAGGPARGSESEVRFVPGIRALGVLTSFQEFSAFLNC